MAYSLCRSGLEPDFFEVRDGTTVVEEIRVLFQIKKVPASFESLEEIHHWLKEIEWKLARGAAYRWLAVRNLASSLLMQKLRQRKYGTAVCLRVIEELEQLGYIQDDEYERSFILREFKRGYGPRYIECKMKAKGLKSDQVRKIVTPEMQREKVKELSRKLNPQQIWRRGFDS